MPWRMMRLRGERVFVRCDATGQPLAVNGRVEIRYKPVSTRAYHAHVSNLEPGDEGAAPLPDDHCTLTEGKAAATQGRGTGGAIKAPEPAKNPPSAPTADECLAYADGACSGNPGPAGLGVVMLWDDRRQELSEFLGTGTNNIAELSAIHRVCEAIPDPKRPVRIYTDSNYSIGVLTKGWKAKANQELIATTRAALFRLTDVKLLYVRGHHGIPLNERADELARQAVANRASTGWVTVA